MPEEPNMQQSIISQVEIQSSLTSQNSDLVEMDQDEETFDSEIHRICEQKIAAIRCIAIYLEQELLANNLNHVTQVVDNMDKLFSMLSDIELAQNRKRRDSTW
ncbi:18235_t:CDS:1, partial [Racocetra persica]